MKFCDRPFTSAYLAPHGEVWPCSWMHCTMGNLYEQNLDEIWNSAAAQAARSSILDGSFAFCRAISCPFMERDELPDLSEEEIRERAVPLKTPAHISIANDRTCNIACTSCRTCIQGPEKGEREKIDAALERLLPFANQAKTLSMNGQGEFLANPSFLRFLNKLRPVHDNFKEALIKAGKGEVSSQKRRTCQGKERIEGRNPWNSYTSQLKGRKSPMRVGVNRPLWQAYTDLRWRRARVIG